MLYDPWELINILNVRACFFISSVFIIPVSKAKLLLKLFWLC
jgi:hypothetical protein